MNSSICFTIMIFITFLLSHSRNSIIQHNTFFSLELRIAVAVLVYLAARAFRPPSPICGETQLLISGYLAIGFDVIVWTINRCGLPEAGVGQD